MAGSDIRSWVCMRLKSWPQFGTGLGEGQHGQLLSAKTASEDQYGFWEEFSVYGQPPLSSCERDLADGAQSACPKICCVDLNTVVLLFSQIYFMRRVLCAFCVWIKKFVPALRVNVLLDSRSLWSIMIVHALLRMCEPEGCNYMNREQQR